jgi:hypothetical protein
MGIVWTGEWVASVDYSMGEAVFFAPSSYIALANSIGIEPDTDPTVWGLLALGTA